ncbi:MAG: sulfite exporter TauE/SafE family protein [Pseudomonadota bacterium]
MRSTQYRGRLLITDMDAILSIVSPGLLLVACGAAFLAGVIKGSVGFGMPTILISSLGTFLHPEIALAGLILPTVASNGMQVFRYGLREAWDTIVRFRAFLATGAITLLMTAQIVPYVPARALVFAIGLVVTIFAVWQITGRGARPGSIAQSPARDSAIGGVVGAIGGASGVWGPPTVIYLTALGTEKRLQMRAQGIIYGMGAALLVFAHFGSGVLNGATAQFSAALIPPAAAGMWIGGQISDRLDHEAFRRLTLIVLILGGLNLLRRGIFG